MILTQLNSLGGLPSLSGVLIVKKYYLKSNKKLFFILLTPFYVCVKQSRRGSVE
jgi:hypothetical protein